MKGNNRYISILEYAATKLEADEYISVQDLIEYLEQNNFKIDSEYKLYQFNNYVTKIFDNTINDDVIERIYDRETLSGIKQKDSAIWIYSHMYINIESYQNYVDYIELKEARLASQEARKYAIWALIISGLSIIISIYLSFHTQTVLLDSNQFDNFTKNL